MTSHLLTMKEVADYLKISERTVKSLVRRRAIVSYKVGGQRRIDVEDVEAYLAAVREA